jgi:hypothetical protein
MIRSSFRAGTFLASIVLSWLCSLDRWVFAAGGPSLAARTERVCRMYKTWFTISSSYQPSKINIEMQEDIRVTTPVH